MTAETYQGKVGLQQRVIPTYRAAFFEALARRVEGGLSVFAGEPLAREGIAVARQLETAMLVRAHNRQLFDPGSAWYLCWQDGFIEWLEAWQPDVLVVEANPRYPRTHQAVAWMHARGRKVTGWGLGAPALRGGLADLRRRQRTGFLQSLDAIIAYSQRGAGQYRELGMPGDKVFVASNAAAPAPGTRPAAKEAQYSGRPMVLFVGRLQERKRVDLLMQACASLPEAMQPRLVIVGEGPVLEDLRKMAREVYPATEFAGAKHAAELEPYFQQADLFVLPGTGGLAIHQAMAHGLPVVVAQGDGTQEDLVRSENGWLVPPGNLEALSDSLWQALSEPARLRRMGEESYRIVSEEINVDKMVDVFITVLNARKT